jgi:hypothetical protein
MRAFHKNVIQKKKMNFERTLLDQTTLSRSALSANFFIITIKSHSYQRGKKIKRVKKKNVLLVQGLL